jgi:hypothetical protein
MNVATVAANSGVIGLMNKLDSEAEAVAIEGKRTGDVCNSENGCDVAEALGSFSCRVSEHTSNEK